MDNQLNKGLGKTGKNLKQQKGKFNFLHYVGFTLLAILFIKHLKPVLVADYSFDILDILIFISGLGFLAYGYKQHARIYREKKDKKITSYFKIVFYSIGGFLIILPFIAGDMFDFFLMIPIIWGIGLVFVIVGLFL